MNEEQFNTNYRERFSAEEKFKIVKEHLMTRTPINELCKKYGITPASFYSWHEQFFSNALMGFNKKRGPNPHSQRQDEEKQALQAEVDRMYDVIAEFTAENIAYKKRT